MSPPRMCRIRRKHAPLCSFVTIIGNSYKTGECLFSGHPLGDSVGRVGDGLTLLAPPAIEYAAIFGGWRKLTRPTRRTEQRRWPAGISAGSV